MIFVTDVGKPIERPFVELATAERQFLGAEPPAEAGHPSRILQVDGRSAWILGIPKPEHLAGYMVPRGEGDDVCQSICSGLASTTRGNAWTVQTMNIPPGR